MQEMQKYVGSVPGSGRVPGRGNGKPLQFSCLENPMDRGAWWATAHGVTESDMTERIHTHTKTTVVICCKCSNILNIGE